jgi:HEPN domain-containing protein
LSKSKGKPSPAKKHARVENLSIFGTFARMGRLGLYMYASDFLSVAKVAAPPKVKFVPARTFLACRALELALKAFLSLKGRPLEQLAGGEFGHDLENLLAGAEREGLSDLVSLEEPQLAEIRRASKYYSEKVFEYPALGEAVQGYPYNPDINLLLDAASAMVAVLEEPCLHAS